MQGIALNMGTDLSRARLKLVGIYLLIIAGVVTLFSLLIIYQATDSFSRPTVITLHDTTINASNAIKKAQLLAPYTKIVKTEYEIVNGVLYFTISFVDGREVKVDLLTGESVIPEESGGVWAFMTKDFDRVVGWIGLGIFLLAGLLSIFVANQTLTPISRNIRKQKEFVSGAAHELRNPLAALHARIESTLRVNGGEVSREVLEDLLSETKRLIGLSEALLSFEKQERKKKNVHPESVLDSSIVVLAQVAHMAKEKHIRMETTISKDMLTIDSEDLQMIVYNLIQNAIKFTPQNGTVSIFWNDKTLRVSDTGSGIPQENIPYIFDRFYKVDSARTSEGNGLGLALVKECVETYGGTIRVQSVLGKGTTFTVVFV